MCLGSYRWSSDTPLKPLSGGSANAWLTIIMFLFRKNGREAYGTGLLNQRRVKSFGGSNPSSSASGVGHGDQVDSKPTGTSSILVLRASLCDEMVYMMVSKTIALTSVWVRLPPKVPAVVVKLGIHDRFKTCCL